MPFFRLLWVLMLVTCTMTSAWAASGFDPNLEWRTVKTIRFRVHYYEGVRNLAIRVARVAEEELDRVGELFGYQPDGLIHIVISDIHDSANGSATVIPRNQLHLRLTAPTELTGLSWYDDWLRMLIIHELAHLCDIDQTWGLTRIARWFFGKSVAMNGSTPSFMTEGVAVYAETLLTQTGRGRSSYVDMILRTAVLGDTFLSIDRAHRLYSDWPGGSAAYFYGGFFHLWLAQQYGEDAIKDWHQFNASMVLPFAYWPGSKAVFGASMTELWERWRKYELTRAQKIETKVRAQGETQSKRLTFHGRNISGIRYSPQGKYIIYSRSSPVDGATVRRIDRNGKNDTALVLETFSVRSSFAPDGSSFYFSQGDINNRFYFYTDLYRYDFATETSIPLHAVGEPDKSLRARSPDVSADGRRLVFVQNKLHQNWVSTANIVGDKHDELEVRILVPPYKDMQHASPRFSPDGKWVAISSWFPGGNRDIIVVDAQTGILIRRVTFDTALDGNPAWSRNGRYLLYESDSDGISNIYAFDMHGGHYYRVTRVIGGAFQPDVSPDGTHLLFRNASAIGFDIHEMPFDPALWERQYYAPGQGYTPHPQSEQPDAPWMHEGIAGDLPRSEEPATQLGKGQLDESYSPFESLLPFHDNWVLIPGIFLTNGDPSFVLATGGSDALGEHAYGLSMGSSLGVQHFNWSAAYTNNTWYPSFGASYTDQAFGFPTQNLGTVSLRQRAIGLSMGLPINRRHSLSASYAYERRDPRDAVSAQVLQLNRGDHFARLQLSYTYRYTKRYAYSVSAEDGFSLGVSGRLYNRALGADFNEVLMTLDVRGYINNPLFDNHVLALRFVTAFAFGPEFRERFTLSGAQGASPFTVSLGQIYTLRGFQLDVEQYPRGTGLMAAYLEYRFPIWHIQRGLWTLPVFVSKLHGAIFAEGGNTFGNGTEKNIKAMAKRAWNRMRGGRIGAGAELRADIIGGWAIPFRLRLGFALPMVLRGKLETQRPLYYFTLGRIF